MVNYINPQNSSLSIIIIIFT